MNIRLNIQGIIRQFLPPHKRQTNRLKWLYGLFDLQGLFDDFEQWREEMRYKIHITSQHQVLEEHLRKLFGENIVIRSYSDRYLEIGLNAESAHWVSFESLQEVALTGESRELFGDVDFIVYAPVEIDWNLLYAEIEKYKLADRNYKIILR